MSSKTKASMVEVWAIHNNYPTRLEIHRKKYDAYKKDEEAFAARVGWQKGERFLYNRYYYTYEEVVNALRLRLLAELRTAQAQLAWDYEQLQKFKAMCQERADIWFDGILA